MKIKTAMLICSLLALVFALAGCADKRDNTSGTGSTSTTSGTSIASQSDITSDTDNGEYEAGKDGMVTDDNADRDETSAPESDPFVSGSDRAEEGDESLRPGDVTDDGIVTSKKDRDGKITSDEAAFASSYITKAVLSDKKICWGLGKERDEKNRPIDAVKAEEKYAALGGRFLTPDGTICLTFDEGYENGYTASILDTLKEKNVKAVFFVTYDYCKSSPELVQRMIDEGHIVGNHTWSHPSMPDCTQKEVWSEVTKLHEYVKSEFGYEMTLFRFPKGEFSERTLDDLRNLGYTSLFWSFAYADWDTSTRTDPAEALAKIEDSTHSGIYLLHAVSETNAKILGPLIDYWQEYGYSVGADI